MSATLVSALKAQPFPAQGYKNPAHVVRQAGPGWARPRVNGANSLPGYPQGVDPIAYKGRARPLRHWRRQLVPVKGSGANTAAVGIPSDTPGGMVALGCLNTPAECKANPCDPAKNTDNCRCPGDTAVVLSENVTVTSDCHCTIVPGTGTGPSNPAVMCCRPRSAPIRRSANTCIQLANGYHSSTQGYLYARCKPYAQNQGAGRCAASGTPTPHPSHSCSGKYPHSFRSLTCPDGSCPGDGAATKAPTHVYNPSNKQFQVQGAVSSGDRIARLRHAALRTNKASLKACWNSAHTKSNLSNCQTYNMAVPAMLRACPNDQLRGAAPSAMQGGGCQRSGARNRARGCARYIGGPCPN